MKMFHELLRSIINQMMENNDIETNVIIQDKQIFSIKKLNTAETTCQLLENIVFTFLFM